MKLLTPDLILTIARTIAERVGLDPGDAKIIKFTNNAVVRLPRAGAVVRIAGSEVIRRRIPVILEAARLYAAHDIPAIRLWPGLEQPMSVEGHQATVWTEVVAEAVAPTPEDLAGILRQIHALEVSPSRLPAWAPWRKIRDRVCTPSIEGEIREYLLDQLDQLMGGLEAFEQIPPLVPRGAIHGDAHLGNLIASSEGVVICDFDSTVVGPREWDLAPAAIGVRRFGSPTHQGLVAAYGVDVSQWPGFSFLARLRELQLVTSVMPVLEDHPVLRPEWLHRLETFRAGDTEARWTPYSDVQRGPAPRSTEPTGAP